MKLGATGDFPEEKLNPDDEGGLRLAVTDDGKNVIMNFGKKVAWIAMPYEQAIQFAEIILKRARERIDDR